MEERKENSQENREVRPLARVLARELSEAEVEKVAGCNPYGFPDGPSGCNTFPDQQL